MDRADLTRLGRPPRPYDRIEAATTFDPSLDIQHFYEELTSRETRREIAHRVNATFGGNIEVDEHTVSDHLGRSINLNSPLLEGNFWHLDVQAAGGTAPYLQQRRKQIIDSTVREITRMLRESYVMHRHQDDVLDFAHRRILDYGRSDSQRTRNHPLETYAYFWD